MQPSRELSRLLEIMAALRTPGTGCAWDLVQDFKSIAPYAIEEACEVVDAIEREDFADLRDELGDLLLQVVFHARMAEELGLFDFSGVVEAVTTKMIRRHPHVFGAPEQRTPEAVEGVWAEIKALEKAEKRAARRASGLPEEAREGWLADVPAALPALTRAIKLQEKASKVGFDWNDARLVLAKIREECDEVEEALDRGDKAHVAEEIGDVLFAVANLARHARTDAEGALRQTNAKFERRFRHIEQRLEAQGKVLGAASLQEMDALWDEAKALENAS
jgi:ATP diphosphatase